MVMNAIEQRLEEYRNKNKDFPTYAELVELAKEVEKNAYEKGYKAAHNRENERSKNMKP